MYFLTSKILVSQSRTDLTVGVLVSFVLTGPEGKSLMSQSHGSRKQRGHILICIQETDRVRENRGGEGRGGEGRGGEGKY